MASKPKTDAPPTAPPALRILSLDEILATDDLGSEVVPMPEWGTDAAVRIRGLSMDDIWQARKATKHLTDDEDRRAALNMEFVLAGVVEPALTQDSLAALRRKSSDAILRLINRIAALNGATKEDGDKLAGEFPAVEPG